MKILHMDIETAPNRAFVWGIWDQNINTSHIIESGYTLCWSAKWHKEKKNIFNRVQYDRKGKVKQVSRIRMLKEIWNLLDQADAVVHYNGNKFDIPKLNQEFLLYGLGVPSPFHQIDLLRTVRQRFKFISNKLDYVCQQLGIGKKHPHTGFQLWIDCMEACKKAWKLMTKYNKQDVFLLEELYVILLPWIKNHPNYALYNNKEVMQCPNCGSTHLHRKGIETTKEMSYQRFKCVGCGLPIKGKKSLLTKGKRAVMVTASKL